jgi:hypothetical protein
VQVEGIMPSKHASTRENYNAAQAAPGLGPLP